jgi:hypothetical protein
VKGQVMSRFVVCEDGSHAATRRTKLRAFMPHKATQKSTRGDPCQSCGIFWYTLSGPRNIQCSTISSKEESRCMKKISPKMLLTVWARSFQLLETIPTHLDLLFTEKGWDGGPDLST